MRHSAYYTSGKFTGHAIMSTNVNLLYPFAFGTVSHSLDCVNKIIKSCEQTPLNANDNNSLLKW